MKDDPVVLEHMGDIHMKLKNNEAAINSWKRSLKFHEKEEGLRERVEKKIKDILRELETRDQ
jgi:predicted negative regulator of RcsB-dependent stress response